MNEGMIARWDNVRGEFDRDGSLRDIYVVETTLADWQSFLDWLRRSPYGPVFSSDGAEAILPATADEVFRVVNESCVLMAIHLGEIQVHCHFFVQSEIELDIDPCQIDARQFPLLLGFLAGLGDQLDKDVRLTHENDRDRPFLVYDHRIKEMIRCPY
jgi:hypothetical protein